MSTIALLTLNGHSYDVRLLNQSFNLPVSWNGFPKQSLAGDGQLRVAMDTPADNFILELMMKTEENPIAEGQLEIYDGTDDMPFRCIKFDKAYITEFRETFDVLNGGEMTTYVQISPMEMTINKRLYVERRFFWLWNRAPQKTMQMKEVVADSNVHINDAYWINPNGEKCKDPHWGSCKALSNSWQLQCREDYSVRLRGRDRRRCLSCDLFWTNER